MNILKVPEADSAPTLTSELVAQLAVRQKPQPARREPIPARSPQPRQSLISIAPPSRCKSEIG
jgi:hypothetical protein